MSWVVAGGPLIDRRSSSLSWAKVRSPPLSLSLSSLSGIRGGGPSLSASSGGVVVGGEGRFWV
jgi:hypothetical protein